MTLMTWRDLLSRRRPKADARIAYGADPNQIGDLWRPAGSGPLVVMIHGGCWQASVADLSLMDWAAADLRDRGFLVWNIEYRRVDQSGGGYPGTYLDVSAAIEFAVAQAQDWGALDGPPALIGHSAGGHLALWAAGRARIPPSSPIWTPGPTAVAGVVALGTIADLESDMTTACGPEPIVIMAGPDGPGRYLDTSPYAMAPLGARTTLITGTDDTTVPPAIMQRYAARARSLGDWVQTATPDGGHVEEIAPGTHAWALAASALERLVRRSAAPA